MPKRLGVIGAGVIGLELGSVWRRLGAKSRSSRRCRISSAPPIADIAKAAAREFNKQGLDIQLGAKVSKAEIKGNEVQLTYADDKGEQTHRRRQAAGRGRPPRYTEGLLAEGTGVKLDARGRDRCRRALLDRRRRRLGGRRLRARPDARAQGLPRKASRSPS